MRAADWAKRRIIEAFRRLPPAVSRGLPGRRLRERLLTFHAEVLRVHPVDYTDAATRTGFRMSGSTADLLQRNVYLYGVWEPSITAWVTDHLREGDTVIDIGANVGYFSLLAARCVGPSGEVIAFEPVPSIVRQLKENIALNGATAVRIVPVIAADTDGETEIFRADPENLGRSSTQPGADRESEGVVSQVRAADVIAPATWGSVRLVKVDTEGDDLRALHGLRPVLEAMPSGSAALVEVTPEDLLERGQTPEQLVHAMRAAGFTRMLAVENSYDGSEYARDRVLPPTDLHSPPAEKTDVIFLKPASEEPASSAI